MATAQYRTPGVYVVEKNAFPSSVVEVATAVPVFVGYTQHAQIGEAQVWRTPVRLTSFREFELIFGTAYRGTVSFKRAKGVKPAPAGGANAPPPKTPDELRKEVAAQARKIADSTKTAAAAASAAATSALTSARAATTAADTAGAKAAIARDSAEAAMTQATFDGSSVPSADLAAKATSAAMKSAIAAAAESASAQASAAAAAARVAASSAANTAARTVAAAAVAEATAAGAEGNETPENQALREAQDQMREAARNARIVAEQAQIAATQARELVRQMPDDPAAAEAARAAAAAALAANEARDAAARASGDAGASGGGELMLDAFAYDNNARYLLHDSMRLFFDNGGGTCYVVAAARFGSSYDPSQASVGGTSPVAGLVKVEARALWDDDIAESLKRATEPTMVVVPDATQLDEDGWSSVASLVISHCGTLMSRIALLDVWGVDREGLDGRTQGQLITAQAARLEKPNVQFPSYAASYYPWLETSIVQEGEVDFRALGADARQELLDRIAAEAASLYRGKQPKVDSIIALTATVGALQRGNDAVAYESAVRDNHGKLLAVSPLYKRVMQGVRRALNLLPPTGAMAGVYTYIDNTFGVWKAPANTGLTSVVAPSIAITHDEQQDLNVPLNGRAINCIRTLPGRGTLVWGARTLDGNSQDWRYINVRRTMMMLEQSIKEAAQAYVFQPNVQSTWVTVRGMIENYLTNKWKQGALMGTTPAEAFSVEVGLGSTMSSSDVLDGYMRVTIKVAISRPAEFIELTFIQQMQTAA